MASSLDVPALPAKKVLFKLNFELQSGERAMIEIKENDDFAQRAETFVRDNKMNGPHDFSKVLKLI